MHGSLVFTGKEVGFSCILHVVVVFFFCSAQSCYLKKVTRTQDGKTQLKHCKMSNNNIWSPLHKNSSLLFIFEESAVLSGRES